MEPKIIEKEALLIAGVAGGGDETGKVWDAYMKLEKISPLKNTIGEEGYEIRLYSGDGPGEVHAGMSVTDADIPAEYKAFFLPASMYAEFEIYPSKGYDSSNAEINNWLSENAEVYKQSRIGDKNYAVEVYDKRYKGEKDPESVVGILIPITKTDTHNMPKITVEQTAEMGRRIEEFAGADVRAKVMTGSDEAGTSSDPVKRAQWFKDMLDRLDAHTDKETREKIMHACGCHCQGVFSKEMVDARDRRRFHKTEEEFLKNELQPPHGTGVRFERDGDVIYNYYVPPQYGMRCYCYLIGGLPEGENASPTHCQCSRAWQQKYREGALGRPIRVELGETAISSGTGECKFIIHLK